jgi:hypothetical protein
MMCIRSIQRPRSFVPARAISSARSGLQQLEYTWLQTPLLEYRDFGFLTRASLEFALRAAGVEPSEPITGPLFDKYLDLAPYPDAKDILRKSMSLGGYPVKR